jgi:hypothetical protein
LIASADIGRLTASKPGATIIMSQTATNAVKAERDRIRSINALPEAVGRENLAMNLATTTDMTVGQVKAALAAAPVGISDDQLSGLWDAALTSRGMLGA